MTQLFISHSHQDSELSRLLVDVIESFFSVPDREILCSSLPGYELDLGSLTSDELRKKMNSAELVVALISPNSLGSNWVLFELGAAWVATKRTVPILAGELSAENLPAALKQNIAGRINNRNDLINLVDVIHEKLGWTIRNQRAGNASIDVLVTKVNDISFPAMPTKIMEELKRSYLDKLNDLPENQKKILSFIQNRDRFVSQVEIQANPDFEYMNPMELYFRLENLRMLGFVEKEITGGTARKPEYSYRIAEEYLSYIEPRG
jgi:hypothetical protein